MSKNWEYRDIVCQEIQEMFDARNSDPKYWSSAEILLADICVKLRYIVNKLEHLKVKDGEVEL